MAHDARRAAMSSVRGLAVNKPGHMHAAAQEVSCLECQTAAQGAGEWPDALGGTCRRLGAGSACSFPAGGGASQPTLKAPQQLAAAHPCDDHASTNHLPVQPPSSQPASPRPAFPTPRRAFLAAGRLARAPWASACPGSARRWGPPRRCGLRTWGPLDRVSNANANARCPTRCPRWRNGPARVRWQRAAPPAAAPRPAAA